MNHDVLWRGLISEVNQFVDGATFPDATDQQILALADAFEKRAGRPLSDPEIDALFALQHKLNGNRVIMENILSGRLKVVGQSKTGEFLYSSA